MRDYHSPPQGNSPFKAKRTPEESARRRTQQLHEKDISQGGGSSARYFAEGHQQLPPRTGHRKSEQPHFTREDEVERVSDVSFRNEFEGRAKGPADYGSDAYLR